MCHIFIHPVFNVFHVVLLLLSMGIVESIIETLGKTIKIGYRERWILALGSDLGSWVCTLVAI